MKESQDKESSLNLQNKMSDLVASPSAFRGYYNVRFLHQYGG